MTKDMDTTAFECVKRADARCGYTVGGSSTTWFTAFKAALADHGLMIAPLASSRAVDVPILGMSLSRILSDDAIASIPDYSVCESYREIRSALLKLLQPHWDALLERREASLDVPEIAAKAHAWDKLRADGYVLTHSALADSMDQLLADARSSRHEKDEQ